MNIGCLKYDIIGKQWCGDVEHHMTPQKSNFSPTPCSLTLFDNFLNFLPGALRECKRWLVEAKLVGVEILPTKTKTYVTVFAYPDMVIIMEVKNIA